MVKRFIIVLFLVWVGLTIFYYIKFGEYQKQYDSVKMPGGFVIDCSKEEAVIRKLKIMVRAQTFGYSYRLVSLVMVIVVLLALLFFGNKHEKKKGVDDG